VEGEKKDRLQEKSKSGNLNRPWEIPLKKGAVRFAPGEVWREMRSKNRQILPE